MIFALDSGARSGRIRAQSWDDGDGIRLNGCGRERLLGGGEEVVGGYGRAGLRSADEADCGGGVDADCGVKGRELLRGVPGCAMVEGEKARRPGGGSPGVGGASGGSGFWGLSSCGAGRARSWAGLAVAKFRRAGMLALFAAALHPVAVFGGDDDKHCPLQEPQPGASLPLLDAVLSGDAASVKDMLWQDASQSGIADGSYGASPLHWAAAKGHEEMIEALLDAGANIEQRTP